MSKRLLPWLVAVAFFMESLDTTVLNTAVPAISEALKVSPLSMKSVLASLYPEPRGFHTDQWLDGRPVRNAPCVCLCNRPLQSGVFSLRRLDLHSSADRVQGCGGAMMVPVGRLTLVRTFAKSELVRAMSFVAIPAVVADDQGNCSIQANLHEKAPGGEQSTALALLLVTPPKENGGS